MNCIKLFLLTIIFSFSITIQAEYYDNPKAERSLRTNVIPILVPEDYPTIQEAIDSCKSGDFISVAPGTYYENIMFSGTKLINLVSRMGPEKTIIDGGGIGTVLWMTNLSLYIRGITIQNGFPTMGGSGIALNIYEAFIEDCVFKENYGSAISCTALGAIYISRCQAINNGAGFGVSDGDFYISDCILENNGAGIANYGYGYTSVVGSVISDSQYSGIYVDKLDCEALIQGCLVENNGRTGIDCRNGIVRNCTIRGNKSGGVYAHLVENCLIQGNSGGYASAGGGHILRNSVIIENNGLSHGEHTIGAGSGSIIENCLIAGNYPYNQYEASIFCGFYSEDNEPAWIKNCTIVGNMQNAIRLESYSQDTLYVENCIITNNSGYGVRRSTILGSLETSHCDIFNNSLGNYIGVDVGPGDISKDPLFTLNYDMDYHLRFDSPCIDKGIDIGVSRDIERDHRPYGDGFDIGADEWTGKLH